MESYWGDRFKDQTTSTGKIMVGKLGVRIKRTDNGKYSFVNRTIKLRNELTASDFPVQATQFQKDG